MPAMAENVVIADEAGVAELARQLVDRAQASPRGRYLLGIAGIGGSGKSTLAGKVAAAVERLWPGACRLVGMDGFHLTSAQLERRGLRDRKGAPQTFDAGAFIGLLRKARDAGQCLDVPVYDRARHEPVMPGDDAHRIGARTRLVVVEGNYLLLDVPPWTQLGELLDETWFLDTPLEVARRWIIERHVRGGRPRQDAEQWYARVDCRNAELVLARRRSADLVVRLPAG